MAKDIRKQLDSDDQSEMKTKKRQAQAAIKGEGFGPGFKKPLEAIRLVSVTQDLEFSLNDRRVLNFLQEQVCRIVNDKKNTGAAQTGFFEVRISELSNAIGANDYDEIRTSIDRLRRMEVQYNKMENREEEEDRHFLGTAPLFTHETEIVDGKQKDGIFRYSFPPGIVALFRKPSPYAYINLSTACSFGSKFSLALYENLALMLNREDNVWTVSVNGLADYLGWPRREGERLDFHAFRTKAIERAVGEINGLGNLSPFRVEVECNPDPLDQRKRRIGSVSFTVISNYDNKRQQRQTRDIFRSEIEERMPDGFGSIAAFKNRTNRALGYWYDFRRVFKKRPADLRALWEMYVTVRLQVDDKRSGLNISDDIMANIAFTYEDELNQKSIPATWSVISLVWHMTVKEALQKSRYGEPMSGLDVQVLGAVNPATSQAIRDEVFKKVIIREQESGWAKAMPRDGVQVDSVSRSGTETTEQAPTIYEQTVIERDAADYGADLAGLDTSTVDGYREAAARVQEAKFMMEETAFKSGSSEEATYDASDFFSPYDDPMPPQSHENQEDIDLDEVGY
jgi:hypothetical protein